MNRRRDDRRLFWVHRNRTRRTRVVTLGSVFSGLWGDLAEGPSARPAKVRDAVSALTDDDFAAHCTLGGVSDDTLHVRVDSPGIVYSMRVKWTPILRTALRRVTRGKVTRVRFEYARD